jgi:hypothetical protein
MISKPLQLLCLCTGVCTYVEMAPLGHLQVFFDALSLFSHDPMQADIAFGIPFRTSVFALKLAGAAGGALLCCEPAV